MSRAAAETLEDLGQGIASLTTISTIAPWLGIIATLEGIIGSFRGVCGDKTSLMAALALNLSEAIWPAAMGLAVGILAFVIHRQLAPQFEALCRQTSLLDDEMAVILAPYRAAPPQFHTPGRTHHFAILVFLTFAWLVQSLAYTVHHAYYPQWAFFRAAWYIAFLFATSIAPICFIWVRALGRSRETIGILTAAICLIWAIVECATGLHLL